jgi:hypothetical protein
MHKDKTNFNTTNLDSKEGEDKIEREDVSVFIKGQL